MQNLFQTLQNSALKHPHSKAIVGSGFKSCNYHELFEQTRQFACALLHYELGPSKQIAILLENRSEYIVALYGIFGSGSAAIPVNNMLTAPEVKHILENSQASAVVTSSKYYELVKQSVKNLKNIKHLILVDEIEKEDQPYQNLIFLNDLLKRKYSEASLPEVKSEDLALLVYTSGTTGRPKGAMLSHGNILADISSCQELLDLSHKDGFLLLLPMFHSFTLTCCIFLPILMSSKITLVSSLQRNVIRREILLHRPSIFIGIPALYNVMANSEVSSFQRIINPIRVYISGSAPLSLDTLQKFSEKFHSPLIEGYGLSEAAPVVSLNPPKGKTKPGTIGLPIPGVKVKVVNEQEVELTSGEVGELIVQGENVMRGYFNDPEATAQAIRGGWLFTGDLAKIDEEGYITIVDRKKDMILVRGINVYPREVEEVLMEHPKVAEAAVIGIPEEQKNEIPKAYIIPVEGQALTANELLDFCKQRLASYKIPRYWEFRSELPRTPTGKILKRVLRKEIS